MCIDTNVLVSGIFWKGYPGRVIDEWIEGRFDLIASLALLDEYKRILRRAGNEIDSRLSAKWITVIEKKVIMVMPPSSPQRWCRDADDDKFIDCSLAGNADYLVTGDKDLLVLHDQFSFEILKPRYFLEAIN